MNLLNLAYVVYIVQVNPTYVYLGLIVLSVGVILMYLMVRGSDEFTVEETEHNSDEFAGVIRDSHGPIPRWLWIAYVVIAIWAIAYLIQHAAEFASFP
jgi:hypothetical protein